MTNPLEQYYRTPKLYTQLPSQGQFYSEDMMETAPNKEVAIYSMSALDQINIKTPDALLNGDALIKVIQNCVPGIKHPKKLVEPDINTLLLAIRIATTGPTLSMPSVCPKCSESHEYDIDLNAILETQSLMSPISPLDLEGELLVYLRPYDFQQRNLTLLNEIKQSQAVNLVQNSDLSEQEKISKLGEIISEMAERTFDIVAKSIDYIKIVKTGQIVKDPDFINEFLKKISSQQAKVIMTTIKQLNVQGIDTLSKFSCQACDHEWEQAIDFDPASFFG